MYGDDSYGSYGNGGHKSYSAVVELNTAAAFTKEVQVDTQYLALMFTPPIKWFDQWFHDVPMAKITVIKDSIFLKIVLKSREFAL